MSWPGRAGARDSIRTDEENGIVSFTYRCGVLGGILLTLPTSWTR